MIEFKQLKKYKKYEKKVETTMQKNILRLVVEINKLHNKEDNGNYKILFPILINDVEKKLRTIRKSNNQLNVELTKLLENNLIKKGSMVFQLLKIITTYACNTKNIKVIEKCITYPELLSKNTLERIIKPGIFNKLNLESKIIIFDVICINPNSSIKYKLNRLSDSNLNFTTYKENKSIIELFSNRNVLKYMSKEHIQTLIESTWFYAPMHHWNKMNKILKFEENKLDINTKLFHSALIYNEEDLFQKHIIDNKIKKIDINRLDPKNNKSPLRFFLNLRKITKINKTRNVYIVIDSWINNLECNIDFNLFNEEEKKYIINKLTAKVTNKYRPCSITIAKQIKEINGLNNKPLISLCKKICAKNI